MGRMNLLGKDIEEVVGKPIGSKADAATTASFQLHEK